MNSLQLVSKIRSKADDLSHNISDLLNAGHDFSGLDKDLLKKQCLDLYELILKLKTESEILEDKIALKPQSQPTNTSTLMGNGFGFPEISEPNSPLSEMESPNPEAAEEPTLQANNFQEVLSWADQNLETLDKIVQKVELHESPEPIFNDLELQEEEILPEISQKVSIEMPPLPIGEINLNKAVENKRIQYTVMPDIQEPKIEPLHAAIKEKEPSYNDKIALNAPPVVVPMADKTIEAPIDNIKSAINLNKKIAFVNILFKENVVEYAKAIDRLNNASDRNDAFRIQNELKHQHQWDNNHELVQDLERLIKRRFA